MVYAVLDLEVSCNLNMSWLKNAHLRKANKGKRFVMHHSGLSPVWTSKGHNHWKGVSSTTNTLISRIWNRYLVVPLVSSPEEAECRNCGSPSQACIVPVAASLVSGIP